MASALKIKCPTLILFATCMTTVGGLTYLEGSGSSLVKELELWIICKTCSVNALKNKLINIIVLENKVRDKVHAGKPHVNFLLVPHQ